MAQTATVTPSQANAQDVRDFIQPIHTAPYPAVDPSTVKLPKPFTVAILGGHGAVGTGLARAYASAGASGMLLCARSVPALEDVAASVKSINPSIKTVVVACDVSSAENVAGAAAVAKEKFGGVVNAVVVNAGYSTPMEKEIAQGEWSTAPELFEKAFGVNTCGTYFAARYFLPLLLEATQEVEAKDEKIPAASFIAISSIAAPMVGSWVTPPGYCASKMAQARIVEILYEQYGGKRLFCASLHPGGVMSEFAKVTPEDFWKYLVDDPNLAGAFCVWLTKDPDKVWGLNGRFLSCKWDVDGLLAKMDEIACKDLLRFRIAL
ncbi:hypothetical protein BDY21DRAFT_293383 [Lineolata rhizophorae]|uniref:NAD(P)-binding protein n=1 Tax=Lineolata rhizophorae TaxID=578093 RepID=A0A6A6NNL6_9PEZI|nr:hypothetical protein BDY21DRAFT_293383 [Lineolata rhizophorae]